ncbi:MAG: hypothetical protein HYV63_21685 [Candidatus Schekmanbacteria bacterium]|nr:hypothetical protein [Candidatus Schekmanbacteria bacterium]
MPDKQGRAPWQPPAPRPAPRSRSRRRATLLLALATSSLSMMLLAVAALMGGARPYAGAGGGGIIGGAGPGAAPFVVGSPGPAPMVSSPGGAPASAPPALPAPPRPPARLSWARYASIIVWGYQVDVLDSAGGTVESVRLIGDSERSLLIRRFSHLRENERYRYRVTPIGTGGEDLSKLLRQGEQAQEGSFYFDVQAEPPSAIAIVAPRAGEVSRDPRPTVSWTAAVDPDPNDSITYEVEMSQVAPRARDFATTRTGDTAIRFDAPLDENTTWHFRVTAVDTTGLRSAATEWQQFVVDAIAEPPSIPAQLAVEVSTTRISFSWQPALDPDPGDSVAGYLFEVAQSEQLAAPLIAETVDAPGFVLDAAKVEPDTKYYARVLAVDRSGMRSEPSPPLPFALAGERVLRPPQPATKTALTVDEGLSWTPTNGPEEVTTYEVNVEDASDAPSEPINRMTDKAYLSLRDINGLRIGGAYRFRVRSFGDRGLRSDWSPFVEITIENRPPGAPRELRVERPEPGSSDGVGAGDALSWQAATDPDNIAPFVPADGPRLTYELQVATDRGFSALLHRRSELTAEKQVIAADVGLCQALQVTTATPLYWRVRAVDAQGLGSEWALPPNGFVLKRERNWLGRAKRYCPYD